MAKSSSRCEGHDFLVFLMAIVAWFLAVTQAYLIQSLSFRYHLQDLFVLHPLTIKAFQDTSLNLMMSQVEQDTYSFMGAYGRKGVSVG